jgi:hypothetical protein
MQNELMKSQWSSFISTYRKLGCNSNPRYKFLVLRPISQALLYQITLNIVVNNERRLFGFSSRAVIYLCFKRMIERVFWVLQSTLHCVVDLRFVPKFFWDLFSKDIFGFECLSATYDRSVLPSPIWMLIDMPADPSSSFSTFLMKRSPLSPNSDAKL